MNDSFDWRPSASLDLLRLRARLLAAVRRFFDTRGYWEVDTPLLSRERVVDPHLEPFAALPEPGAPGGQSTAPIARYLHTSPEFGMKRLLAAGAEAIYQIAHVFRAGELGRLHNPEFTMVEWYRVGQTHIEQMRLVEELVVEFCEAVRQNPTGPCSGPRPGSGPEAPFARTTYRDAFLRHAGEDLVLMKTEQIPAWAAARGMHPPPGLASDDRDGWLNWLLAELVEPQLGSERPEFLFDYPASQAALAVIRPDDPPVAERFELYWRGIELCNGYHELRDPRELCRRIEVESRRRVGEGLPSLPLPGRFLAAIQSGLPACAGVALGFDRLLMLAAGAQEVREVIPFAFEQA
jgi:lysyl-tRNA synthetase class 2